MSEQIELCKKCDSVVSSDNAYCEKCLSTCVSCDEQRPDDFTEMLYYCDDHGCISCHSKPKHIYYLLRQRYFANTCLSCINLNI